MTDKQDRTQRGMIWVKPSRSYSDFLITLDRSDFSEVSFYVCQMGTSHGF